MGKIEYRLGRVMCKTGFTGVSEGLITAPEQIKAAFEALQLYRSGYGGTQWISDNTHGLIPTEEKAEEVISYLRAAFNRALKFAGEKPIDCAHGKIFFRKFAQLELTAEQETSAREGISKILSVAPLKILGITYMWG